MRNNNKCRICGYRFKDKDEVICPECFTAREEDISCDSYSRDLHNHDNNGYSLENNYTQFTENEIFEEDTKGFLEKEQKNEEKSKILQGTSDKNKHYNNYYIGNYANSYQSNSQNQPFPRQTVNDFQKISNSQTNNKGKNNKRSNLIVVIIIILIIILINL